MVKNWIKSKILDNTFLPKQKIHSESELMGLFNVSRHTVRLALGELVSDGWLYKEQGAGTYVSDRTEHNSEASNGVSNKSIAIIVTYISDYIFPSIIRGAESILSQEGYQVSLYSTNNDHAAERKILETIIAQKFDGVIVEATKSAISNPNLNYYLSLESLKIPYVMINAAYDELEPVSVVLDDEKGGYIQAEHLINLGHSNMLGFFKSDDLQGLKRMKGYLKAQREHGIPIHPDHIITYTTDEKLSKPIEMLENILKQSEEIPTGIVCYNDELAMKLLDVLRQKNVRVPHDMSIIGFDDSFFADISEVKLTTVRHPKSELGEMAAKKVIELIHHHQSQIMVDARENSFLFEPEIVHRNSTKETDYS
ncbi:substrate-binding domain-containing protein [Bacillus lacus]|uniref:Substrate-binding domain-containing protein n=1 Tax=Metabacillus lacus TaxID=1983721 RepID=A0A7X2IXL7_9BACI|nr:GntR family transcriptional regulator [Metabacillus lacus]MRX71531.1 substrate-binding domain-containing protein [Metabacillus lacus]